MPISLESNSATMLINQYAHGLAGKAPPLPLPLRSISRFAVFRSSNAIAHRTTRTNEQPTVPHRTVHRGADAAGEGRGGRLCPPSLALPLSLSLTLSRSRDYHHFRFRSYHRSTTYHFNFFAEHVRYRSESKHGTVGGNGTKPPRIVPNLSPPLSSSREKNKVARFPSS